MCEKFIRLYAGKSRFAVGELKEHSTDVGDDHVYIQLYMKDFYLYYNKKE